MEFLKTTAGKVISGMVALVVVAAAISWWRMDESTRHMLLSGTGKIVAWFGVVLLVPWAMFFIIGWVNRLESNLAGGLLVAGFTLVEVVLLLWLFDWSVSGPAAWTFVGFGGLLAAVYNLFACDWIAEKMA
jgi:hypothetical protein